MKPSFPVHPDDQEQLLKIRRYLIGCRKVNGWSQPQLSQMISGTDGMAWDLESSKTWQWRLSRLQDWPVPFGLRLTARLRFPDPLATATDDEGEAVDLTWAVESHPEVAPLLSLSLEPGAWQKWQRMYLTSALRVARIELNVSTTEMANRLGVTRKAISGWESVADEVMLPKVLAYARTLGGYIKMGLTDGDTWHMYT